MVIRQNGIEFLDGPQKTIPEGWQTFRYKCEWISGQKGEQVLYTHEIREFHTDSNASANALLKHWNERGNGVRTYKAQKKP